MDQQEVRGFRSPAMRRHVAEGVILLAFAASGTACSSSSSPEAAETVPTVATSVRAARTATIAGAPSVFTREDFQISNFDENSIEIDNRHFPLIPGAQNEYEGSTVEDGKTVPHRVTSTVTNLTKRINGVNTVVIWERDFSDGELQEDELTFFAQDKAGNVWHMGQYSELWESGEYTAGRTWFPDHPTGAVAGIMMKADPKPNTPDWSEGFAPPPYFWSDRARVRSVDEETTVPTGTYKNVLVVEENNEEEPSAIQLKYYAPGVGFVRVGWDGTDQGQETLVMVRTEKLTPEKLEAASRSSLELETRALVHSTAGPSVMRK